MSLSHARFPLTGAVKLSHETDSFIMRRSWLDVAVVLLVVLRGGWDLRREYREWAAVTPEGRRLRASYLADHWNWTEIGVALAYLVWGALRTVLLLGVGARPSFCDPPVEATEFVSFETLGTSQGWGL